MTRTDPPVVTAGPDKITAAIDHDRTDTTTLERAEATIRRGLLDAARGLGDIRDALESALAAVAPQHPILRT